MFLGDQTPMGRWIDKKPFSGGFQAAAENFYRFYLPQDREQALREIHYIHEKKEEEDFSREI